MDKINTIKVQFKDVMAVWWERNGKEFYKYWIETYGENHVEEWLKANNYDMDACEESEYLRYLTDKFIEWLEDNRN